MVGFFFLKLHTKKIVSEVMYVNVTLSVITLISQETHPGSVSKMTHMQNTQADTHLFNFFTSPAQSEIFPFVESSSLFIFLRRALEQFVASRVELHLKGPQKNKQTHHSALCVHVSKSEYT